VPRAALLVLVIAPLFVIGWKAQPGASAKPPTRSSFVSRPDLTPPLLDVTKDGPAAGGYLFLAAKEKKDPGGPMILDPDGQLVWFEPIQPKEATDFRVQTWRGKPVLTWWEGRITQTGVGIGRYVISDQTYKRIAEFGLGNGLTGDLHEFRLTPRGTALVLAYKPVVRDLTTVGVDKRSWVYDSVVQEVTVPGARVLFEWHSIDHVPLAESVSRKPAKTASRKAPFDYFHVNSVDLEPNGNLLVSARNTHTLYEIDRKDGHIVWRLGGKESDFAMGPGTRFGYQHDARRQRDGTITLFDNSATPAIAKFSRALVIRADEKTKRATLVHAYAHPKHVLSPHQGDAQRMANGDTLVGFGGKPYIAEFTRDGRVVLDAKLVVGDFYRAYRFPWHARPTTTPTVVVRGGKAYVSWNGATEVAQWEVRAGDTLRALTSIAQAPKRGFETAIDLETDAKLVAVAALDAKGRTLAVSKTVER